MDNTLLLTYLEESIRYLPIFILSTLSGFAGLFYKRKLTLLDFAEVTTGYGLKGVCIFILLSEFSNISSDKVIYAIVIIFSYGGIEELRKIYDFIIDGLKK